MIIKSYHFFNKIFPLSKFRDIKWLEAVFFKIRISANHWP